MSEPREPLSISYSTLYHETTNWLQVVHLDIWTQAPMARPTLPLQPDIHSQCHASIEGIRITTGTYANPPKTNAAA